jgi:hypothetical protein
MFPGKKIVILPIEDLETDGTFRPLNKTYRDADVLAVPLPEGVQILRQKQPPHHGAVAHAHSPRLEIQLSGLGFVFNL